MSLLTRSIYPTRRAILLVAAGAPLSIAAATVLPNLWLTGAAWILLALGLLAIDLVFGAWESELRLEPFLPTILPLGISTGANFRTVFAARIPPRRAEFVLDTNPLIRSDNALVAAPVRDGVAQAHFRLHPTRRGDGRLLRLWVRWQGPLALVWKQHVERLDAEVPIIPNIQSVKEQAAHLIQRNTLFGANLQRDIGDGAQFHALRDFRAGMDTRTIDWKQSAKHVVLLAKEFEAERNQQIVLALDTGHLMCEPLNGQPRVDRALHAALLLAYAALKLGDRVRLFAFDAKPRLSSGAISGARAFSVLQHLASRIDYSHEETNYTLGLTQLSGELHRRSLIVIFTDFVDTTSAELMIENVQRLLRQHLVVFVVFRDEELETLANIEPRETADVSRAVIADALLREREIVTTRLRRLGVEIVEAPAESAGANLLDTYFKLKRRNAI